MYIFNKNKKLFKKVKNFGIVSCIIYREHSLKKQEKEKTERKNHMKKKSICLKRAISAILAVGVISSCAMAVSADNTLYYTDNYSLSQSYYYSDNYISISGNNLTPNIDNGEKLSFSVSNVYGANLMFLASPQNGLIEQKSQDGLWTSVSGSHGKDPVYDNMTPSDLYSSIQTLGAYGTLSYDMDVSFLDAGEYRLKLYMLSTYGEYIEEYVYFAVKENVTAYAESTIYTSSPTLNLSITNNLPVNISTNLANNLKIMKYTDGKWVTSDIVITNTSKKSTIKSGKTTTIKFPFSNIDSSYTGKYRITIDFDVNKSEGDNYPDSKTVSVDFNIEDPADIELLSTTADSRDLLTVSLRIKNNTGEAVTVDNIGRVSRKANSKWLNLALKNNAKSFDTQKCTINPGEEKFVKVNLSDYYRSTRFSVGLTYRITVNVNGKTYYKYFKISKGTIQVDEHNSATDKTYYILDETEI